MRSRRALVSLLVVAALWPLDAFSVRGPAKAQGVQRDSRDRIARSSKAITRFKRASPCPATGKGYGSCPGYVIDHVVPLKRGGPDAPGNMQWQTISQAREKDKWE